MVDHRKLYVRIADELCADMAAGRFPVGKPLPPIRELAERFGSARGTIERAIKVLRSEGLLDARQGARTIVIALPADGAGATGHGPAAEVDRLQHTVEQLTARVEEIERCIRRLTACTGAPPPPERRA